jgi:hypothetical protein
MLPRFRSFSGFLLAVGIVLLLLIGSTGCGRRAARTARRPPLPPPTSESPVFRAEWPTGGTALEADPQGAPANLTDAERRASARAAFAEGVQLQERADCPHALPRFEVAQRMYDAPTHLLHIGQCQAATGRLVEAQETYATLGHLPINAQAPAPFRQAQSTGRAELSRLKPRIPTLRLETSPPAASLDRLVVQINGTVVPADLVGIARPVNPGRYRVTVAAARGRSGVGEVEIKEGDAKVLEVRLAP